MNELIEQIHADFKTAGDKMAKQAQLVARSREEMYAQVSRNEKLSELGFTNHKKADLDPEEELNQARIELEAINHYKLSHPHIKFITRSSIDKLCKKYSLAFGKAEHYTGDIPVENQKAILNFELNEDQGDPFEFYIKADDGWGYRVSNPYEMINKLYGWSLKFITDSKEFLRGRSSERNESRITFKIYNCSTHDYVELQVSRYDDLRRVESSIRELTDQCENMTQKKLCIVAPPSDFTKIEDPKQAIVKVFVPDPIVLKPLKKYNNVQVYAVVTAWGPEAQDPEVYNEILN